MTIDVKKNQTLSFLVISSKADSFFGDIQKITDFNQPKVKVADLSQWGFNDNCTYTKNYLITPFIWKTYLIITSNENNDIFELSNTFPLPYALNAVKTADSWFKVDLTSLSHKVIWSMKDLKTLDKLQLNGIYIYPSAYNHECLTAKTVFIDRIIWSLNVSHKENGELLSQPFPIVLIENYPTRICIYFEDTSSTDQIKTIIHQHIRESNFIKKYISLCPGERPTSRKLVPIKYVEIGFKSLLVDSQIDIHWIVPKLFFKTSYLIFYIHDILSTDPNQSGSLEEHINGRMAVEITQNLSHELVYIVLDRIDLLLANSVITGSFRFVSEVIVQVEDGHSLDNERVDLKMIWTLSSSSLEREVIDSLMKLMGHFMCIFGNFCKVSLINSSNAESLTARFFSDELENFFRTYDYSMIKSILINPNENDSIEEQTAATLDFAIAVKKITSLNTRLPDDMPKKLKWTFSVQNKYSSEFFHLLHRRCQSSDFERHKTLNLCFLLIL